MKLIVFSLMCLGAAALAASTGNVVREAESCDEEVCTGNNCYCSVQQSPLAVEDTPQFVTLAFTDAVTDLIYTDYLIPMLDGRTNSNGGQVGATLYVPHEYTDYEAVNDLYNLGLEIAVHTISKNSLSSYWAGASVETLVEEFYGQRQIISRFANIPIEDITGARVPNLEMAGDNLFEAYQESGIEYDNSWVALSSNKFFPYTLDYLSTQRCNIGTCPTESYPGFFELPVINIEGADSVQCNSIQGCGVSGTASEVSSWLIEQFQNFYGDNKAPLTLTVNSAWFAMDDGNYDGLISFLDYLQGLDDVYLVSHKQVMDWMKNPVAASSYQPVTEEKFETCGARTCELLKEEEEYRYMKSCVNCPAVYPWLGNPLGT